MGWRVPAIIAGAAVATYVSVLVVPYAFEDDYWILGAVHGLGGANVWKSAVAGGRPVQGLLLTGVFSLTPDIDSLRMVRGLALAGVVVLGILLYYALRRAGLNRWVAVAAAVTVITLPSFQVYVSWAVLFEAPYAAILAGLAWQRLPSTLEFRSRAALLRYLPTAALLLGALITYQPTAMIFWVFAAIDVLRPSIRLGPAIEKLVAGIAVAAAALAVSYVFVRIGVHFYGAEANGRSTLNHDLVGKLRWFWNQPLLNSLNLFELVPKWSLAALIAGVAAVGMLLLHAERGVQALGFLAIAVILVPLSYLPNLVTSEDWASYRSIGALSALVAVLLWLGLWGIGRATLPLAGKVQLRTQVFRFAGYAIAAGIAATAVLVGARNVTTLFAEPENLELQMLRTTLNDSNDSPTPHVVFIKPRDGAAPVLRYDEFGFPSSYAPWVPSPAVQLVLRERWGAAARPVLAVYAWDQERPRVTSPRPVVVDMRELRKHRVPWSIWTFHDATG